MHSRVILFVTTLLMSIVFAAGAFGQKPGDKVEYKDTSSWPEKWEVGTFVRELPGGTQVLIRRKPTEFFPEGAERAYAKEDVRPLGAQVPADPPRDQPVVQAPIRDGGGAVQPGQAGGLMSQADVLNYLSQRFGNGDPFRHKDHERILAGLRQEILSRGVNFRYEVISDFSNKLKKYGAVSNITAPIEENFGPLGKQAELMGTWRFAKVGAAWNPMFGNSGSMTINANGTYVWNTNSGVIRGQWRKATPTEMAGSDKGGQGIVLLKGKGGEDWLVFKRDEIGPEGKGIKVTDLGTRGMRERGVR